MSTIKCLIVDDEPLGRRLLTSLVKKVKFLELVAVCQDAFEALDILENNQVDLLLTDIQMPEINGLEFVRSLPSPPVIIFITAHDRFAVSSYELAVADYLLKPVSFDRFLKAVNKARAQIDSQKQTSTESSRDMSDYIFVRADSKLKKLVFNDILYIEAVKDYIKIFTSDGMIMTNSSMKAIEEKLLPGQFIRIHNSYIISVKAVITLKHDLVELFDGTSLPVAKSRKDDLFAALKIDES